MTGYSYAANTTPAADNDWRHRAACRDTDPELHFPIGNTGPALLQIEEARAVCRRCPVRTECLTWALDSGQDSGVWGGMSEDERRALNRRQQRQPTAAQVAELQRRRAERDTALGAIRELAGQGFTDQQIADTLNHTTPGARWSSGRVQAARSRAGIRAGYHVGQRGQGAA